MAATKKNQLFDPIRSFRQFLARPIGRTVLPQYKTSQTDDDR